MRGSKGEMAQIMIGREGKPVTYKDVKEKCHFCDDVIEGKQMFIIGRRNLPFKKGFVPNWFKRKRECWRRWRELSDFINDKRISFEFYLCPEHSTEEHFDQAMQWAQAQLDKAEKLPTLALQGNKKGEKSLRIGGIVKIKKCDPIPEVVGESAEIVDMQMLELDKYAVYPLWVKMTSGERKGRIYGFRYDEVEVVPKAQATQKAMGTKVVKQVEEILRGITTVEDIAEVERVIDGVKGKILAEPTLGFWEGKTPCWEMFRCPEAIKIECPAFKYRTLPCWQIEGTYSKLDDYGTTGLDTSICEICRVYKRYGHGEPIQIKLFGKGIDTSFKSVSK